MENATNTMVLAPPPAVIDLESIDMTMQRLALKVMIDALKNGPKSRERSIVITKLEEARMWAGEAMMTDPPGV